MERKKERRGKQAQYESNEGEEGAAKLMASSSAEWDHGVKLEGRRAILCPTRGPAGDGNDEMMGPENERATDAAVVKTSIGPTCLARWQSRPHPSS